MPSPVWIGITWRHSRRSVERQGPATSDWCRPSTPMLDPAISICAPKAKRKRPFAPAAICASTTRVRVFYVGIVAAKMVAPLLIGPLMIYHPIPAASVARALVNLSFRDEPGVFIQQYSELVAAD